MSPAEPRREHDVAVLAALALVDADHHAPAVDRVDREVDGLGNAQAGGIAGGQDGVVLDVVDAPRNRTTSKGLRTTGSFCGCGRREDLLEDPAFLSVTL